MKPPLKSQQLEESASRCPWVSLPLAFIRWIPDWSAALGERLTFAFASHLESAWSLSWLESCHFYATASWGTHAVPGRTHHLCLHFAVGTWLSSEQSVPPFLASGWDQWALHGMDSLPCNTPTHSWLVLCPDQHFCRSPVTFTWLKNAWGCTRWPDYETGRKGKFTSWRRAENVLATSYFDLPLTISLKDAVPVLSVLDESVSRICSPYEPISKGGFLSWQDVDVGVSAKQVHRCKIVSSSSQQQTCSSNASSILSFHVETRASISLCFSTSAMLARRAFCMKNYLSVLEVEENCNLDSRNQQAKWSFQSYKSFEASPPGVFWGFYVCGWVDV